MSIRVGIGGWTFKPWRGTFYPKGLRQADEMEFAVNAMSGNEINGTYYGPQKPETYAKWAAAAPDGFQFSIKALRYCTNRKNLREAKDSIDRFLNEGPGELGDKLGPVLWQFMPFKQFDPAEFEDFLDLLPDELNGRQLRHVLDVRHDSFCCEEFIDLARKHNKAIVFTHSDKYPTIADQTADFSYARLMKTREEIETGYTSEEIDDWASVANDWHNDDAPSSLETITNGTPPGDVRDVYMYFISGAKVRAPAAAKALMERLDS